MHLFWVNASNRKFGIRQKIFVSFLASSIKLHFAINNQRRIHLHLSLLYIITFILLQLCKIIFISLPIFVHFKIFTVLDIPKVQQEIANLNAIFEFN